MDNTPIKTSPVPAPYATAWRHLFVELQPFLPMLIGFQGVGIAHHHPSWASKFVTKVLSCTVNLTAPTPQNIEEYNFLSNSWVSTIFVLGEFPE